MMVHNSAGHGATYIILALVYAVALVLIHFADIHSLQGTLTPNGSSKHKPLKSSSSQEKITPKEKYFSTLFQAVTVEGSLWMIVYTCVYKCGELCARTLYTYTIHLPIYVHYTLTLCMYTIHLPYTLTLYTKTINIYVHYMHTLYIHYAHTLYLDIIHLHCTCTMHVCYILALHRHYIHKYICQLCIFTMCRD